MCQIFLSKISSSLQIKGTHSKLWIWTEICIIRLRDYRNAYSENSVEYLDDFVWSFTLHICWFFSICGFHWPPSLHIFNKKIAITKKLWHEYSFSSSFYWRYVAKKIVTIVVTNALFKKQFSWKLKKFNWKKKEDDENFTDFWFSLYF